MLGQDGSFIPTINRKFGRSRAPVDLREPVSYHRFMSLLRGLFWLVLFIFFTFCFVVLFEYGTHDFVSGFQAEFEKVKTFAKETAKPSPKPKK
jgi:hypothetical protein